MSRIAYIGFMVAAGLASDVRFCLQNKFEKREYQNSHALVEDLRVMLDNALLFNEEGSPVWSDAWGMRVSLNCCDTHN